MRGSIVAMATVVVMMMAMGFGPAPCHAQWPEIAQAVTAQLTSLWQNNELEFMGSTCFYSQQPRFNRWELYYHGDFSCPTWTNIKGSAKTRSRSSVMIKTIEDFLNKAHESNLVSDEEARVWLEGYKNK